VFKLTPGGIETILLAFGHPFRGQHPFRSLLYSQGRLYGTMCGGGDDYMGVVFELDK
jgi:hypothetical protein